MNRRPPQSDRTARVRRDRRGRNRKRPEFLAILRTLLVLVLIGQSLRVAFASPRLRLQEVTVQGSTRLKPEDITREGHVPLGANIFRVNLVKVSEWLMTDPIIREATVTRDLPNRLHVEIRERTAAYQVTCDGARWDVDAEGVVYRKNPSYLQGQPTLEIPRADLPPLGKRLRSDIIRAYHDSIRCARKEGLDLRHLRVDPQNELWLSIVAPPTGSEADGTSDAPANPGRLKVRVGRFTDLPQKFRDIRQALEGWPQLTATAAHLDVMCPGRPAYMKAARNADQESDSVR